MRTSATEEEDGGACGFSEGFRSSPNPFICYRYFCIHIVAPYHLHISRSSLLSRNFFLMTPALEVLTVYCLVQLTI